MFENLKKTLVDFFNSLSKKKKIILISGVAAGILLLTFLILFFTKTEYVVLSSGLDAASAKEITSKLDELGIQWKSDPALSMIEVPKKDVAKAKMEVSIALQAGSVTWQNVFQGNDLTMSEKTRSEMYAQALANELEVCIKTISSVKNAEVILYIPKDSQYFIEKKDEAGASVLLELKNPLEKERVNGIVNIICSAVKGLEPKNVTILDQSGLQLNDPDSESSEFSASSAYELKTLIQDSIKRDVEDFLGVIYGRKNVNVNASVKLDFDKQSSTVTKYAPPVDGSTEGMLRSATKIKENVSHEAGIGAPGTDTNVTAVTENNDTGVYQKASETLNYELNETIILAEKAEGQIQELTIAVCINQKALNDEKMTDEHRSELVDLVSSAVGTAPKNVRVSAQDFADPLADYDVYLGGDEVDNAKTLMYVAAIVAGVVIIIIIAIFVLLKKKRKREREEQERLEELARIEAETQEVLDEIGEDEDKGSPKYQIEKFIDKNPEAAAVLLRTWLNE